MMGYLHHLAGHVRCAGAATLACLSLALGPGPAAAREEAGALSPRIGEAILGFMEDEALEDWQAVSDGYAGLLERQDLSAYERATLLQLYGRARYELGDPGGTVDAWLAALALDVLPGEAANTLRINAGQIMLAEGRHAEGIALIETALERGVALTADIAMRLAQGYGQTGELERGLGYAEQAFALAEPPVRSHFSLRLYFYQQLDRIPEQAGLLAQMVERWPGEAANWRSYASLLARTGRERDAFEINRIMYLNGMLDSSESIVRLAQYYSYYEYPYAGAGLLERELNAGRVDPTDDNFRLLANMWRQAREWERALPVLRRVATLTGTGRDYEVLGEAFYQAGAYGDAEAMFVQALHRGGLSRPGDTWTLVGNARMEQDRLVDAADAFERALQWEYSRARAQGWLDFIERKIAIQQDGIRLARLTQIEGCELTIERMRRSVAVSEDEYDSGGRRIFDLPADCEPWFDVYGSRREEADRS